MKKPYNILTDYQPTGNKVIDQVAVIIMNHRVQKIALKAIHLKPLYYVWFKKGVEILQGKALEEGQLMSLDGVNIELGDKFQQKPMLIEPWPILKAEVLN
jgi:hypothetical protein